jgi:hypothetical protein
VWCCGVHWVAVQVYKDQIWKVRNIRLLLSLSLSLWSVRACVLCVYVCQRLGSGGGDEKHLCGVLSSVDMCL